MKSSTTIMFMKIILVLVNVDCKDSVSDNAQFVRESGPGSQFTLMMITLYDLTIIPTRSWK